MRLVPWCGGRGERRRGRRCWRRTGYGLREVMKSSAQVQHAAGICLLRKCRTLPHFLMCAQLCWQNKNRPAFFKAIALKPTSGGNCLPSLTHSSDRMFLLESRRTNRLHAVRAHPGSTDNKKKKTIHILMLISFERLLSSEHACARLLQGQLLSFITA